MAVEHEVDPLGDEEVIEVSVGGAAVRSWRLAWDVRSDDDPFGPAGSPVVDRRRKPVVVRVSLPVRPVAPGKADGR